MQFYAGCVFYTAAQSLQYFPHILPGNCLKLSTDVPNVEIDLTSEHGHGLLQLHGAVGGVGGRGRLLQLHALQDNGTIQFVHRGE